MGGPPNAYGGDRFPGGTTEEAVRRERVAFRRRLCLLVPVPPVRPVAGQSVHIWDLCPSGRGCRVRHVQDPSLPSQGRPATEDQESNCRQESNYRTDIPWRGNQLNGPEKRWCPPPPPLGAWRGHSLDFKLSATPLLTSIASAASRSPRRARSTRPSL